MSNGSDLYDFGSMVIIRQKFLKITERNLCTSSVLDRLYAEVTTKLEDAWYEIEHYNKKFDSIAKFSVNLLYIYQCEVFTKEEIVEALNFLIKKEYIRVVDQQHNTYSFYVDMQKIDRETTPPPLRQEDITEQDVILAASHYRTDHALSVNPNSPALVGSGRDDCVSQIARAKPEWGRSNGN